MISRLWMVVLLMSLGGGIPEIGAALAGDICPATISNQRDVSFSIVWGSTEAAIGYVEYGLSPGNLNQLACDDRDPGLPCGLATDTHFVTVTDLSPSTTYYLRTVTGGVATESVIQVETGPTLSIPATDSVYGQVFGADHATPADGAYVCATVSDLDTSGSPGTSSPACALVSSSYWSVNLGNIRTQDRLDWFDYSASGDELLLSACGAVIGCDARQVDTAADTPAAELYLDAECHCFPAEITELGLDKQGSIVLGWPEQGLNQIYDVAGGPIAQLQADQGVTGALCLAGGLGDPQWTDTQPPPLEGEAHYFMARGRNSCGVGIYGLSSGGDERVTSCSP